jgi:hypothetical protein
MWFSADFTRDSCEMNDLPQRTAPSTRAVLLYKTMQQNVDMKNTKAGGREMRWYSTRKEVVTQPDQNKEAGCDVTAALQRGICDIRNKVRRKEYWKSRTLPALNPSRVPEFSFFSDRQ